MQITDNLSLKAPVFQAPLEGYPNQHQLVAAISNAGGLGVYHSGFRYLSHIVDDIKRIRQQTTVNFGVLVNMMDGDTGIDLADHSATNGYVTAACQALKIDAKAAPVLPDVNAVCKTVAEQKPPVMIFQNGIPADAFIEHCKHSGITTFAIAGNTLEAIAIDSTLIDGIVLQGIESAGLGSRFENDLKTESYPIDTLLHHVAKHTQKPLVVWGDVQTPTAATAKITAGAKGVMLDVPLWTVDESPLPESYREALATHNEMLTEVVDVWQGMPSRVIGNALTQRLHAKKGQVLSSRKQQRLMWPIIEAAIAQNNADYMPLWVGLCAVPFSGSAADACEKYRQALAKVD